MSDRQVPELSRREFLALAGAMSLLDGKNLPRTLLMMLQQGGGEASPSPVVVRGNARFQILSPTVMRMEYAPTGYFINALSVSVLNRSWPACPFQVHDLDGWLEIATSRMRVKYKLDSGEFGPENLTVRWTDANGEHAWKPGDVDDKNLGGVPGDSFGTLKPPNEHRGPLSRNGYFWLDDSGTAVWNATTQWPEPRQGPEGAQDWYFFTYGHEYKACLRELAQLLGPIPMVPRYVFGTWYGDRAAYSSGEWQRIVHRFREEEIPLDVLGIDSYTWGIMIWRGFGFTPELMPDPKAFFAWMKAHGVKTGLIEHYGAMTPDSEPQHFEQIRETLGLPAGTKEIGLDLADKRFAQLYMDLLHKPALDMGMDFWWQDGCAEDTKMPGLDPYLWTRHIEYTGTERITGKRAIIYCRLSDKGFAPKWGVHRYGLSFTGDAMARWTLLDTMTQYMVRSGNILVPFVSHDTPAVAVEDIDHELYLRAVQASALAPIFWWVGLWGQRLPWEYGEDGIATCKLFLTLRYRLVPYMYTYARLAHETGAPLVRGTYLEYPEQEPAYTFTLQYLFGQELLVAPITELGRGQPVYKEIYLPAEEHWYDYFTGHIYVGGQVLSYVCPLSRMPIFVKAGSILPIAPQMNFTDQRPLDLLIVDVYAGKPATFRVYEDDGASLDYRKQAFGWTQIDYAATPTAGRHVITIKATEGQYQGQPKARCYRIQMHGLLQPGRVVVNGRLLLQQAPDVMAEGWVWNQAAQVAEIHLTTPVDIRKVVTVVLEQAGGFPDVVALQAVQSYRARVQRVRNMVKLRWAMLLVAQKYADSGNEPHVWQESGRIEQTLNDLVDNPVGMGAHSVDFKRMTTALLGAFVNQPFASTRKLPSKEPLYVPGEEGIAQGTFTLDELHRMTAELLACEVVVSATENTYYVVQHDVLGPLVRARFSYDRAIIDPPQLTYEFRFPNDGIPGWTEISREVQPDGSATFKICAPVPPRPGSHTLTLKVTATWSTAQAVVEREFVWTVDQKPTAEVR